MNKLFLIISFFIITQSAYAETNINIGTSGFQFLNIGVGARPVSLGEAFCAVGNDINTIYYNPAGLGNLLRPELSLSYNKWFLDIGEGSIGYVQPIYKIGVFGLNILYLGMGDEIARDKDTGEQTGTFTSYDAAIVLSYGKILTNEICVGSNIKIFQEKMEEEKASGICMDLGYLYKLPITGLTAGMNLQNIGPGIKFISDWVKLPFNIKMGLSYCSKIFLISFDLNKPIDDYLRVNLGAEYTLRDIFKIRLGYNTNNSFNQGITAGMGIKAAEWMIDYAFVPYGNLSNTHRVSVSAKFGKEENKEIKKTGMAEEIKPVVSKPAEPKSEKLKQEPEIQKITQPERHEEVKKETIFENKSEQVKPLEQNVMEEGKPVETVKINVNKGSFCTGVENKQPVNVGTEFNSNVGKVYFWTIIQGTEIPTTIRHVWYYKEKEMSNIELSVKFPNQRTWSYKTIMPQWIGEWKVRVVDSEGNLLKEVSFIIK